MMEDKQIVDLYWARSEAAIEETDKKYGRHCYCIANRILNDEEDAKEIYSNILGYDGTSCAEMDPEYIKEIVYRKIDQVKGTSIPKDIINVVLEAFQSNKLAINFDKYKDLIENVSVNIDKLNSKNVINDKLSKTTSIMGSNTLNNSDGLHYSYLLQPTEDVNVMDNVTTQMKNQFKENNIIRDTINIFYEE